ncbi:hypothetical protein ACFV0R_11400 [Streptomyces sp. NPDC059578]|uniref:hypothetical protein n=1 Tax=Streptomyces sp. NPDC059578 TaxID=3346874 RepID=UPI0036904051
MNLRRDTNGQRTLMSVVTAAVLFFAASGCGGDGQDGDGKRGQDPSAAVSSDREKKERAADDPSAAAPESQQLSEVKGGGLTLTVTSAVRGEGGFITVQGTVSNGSGQPWSAGEWRGDESELAKNGGSIAGASLVDNTGKKKYLVLRDTEGRCLCTRFTGGILSGDTAEWFAQFPAPPEGTTKVDFQVGSMPPASIEISEGE